MTTSARGPEFLAAQVHDLLTQIDPNVNSWESLWGNVAGINDDYLRFVTESFLKKTSEPYENPNEAMNIAINIARGIAHGEERMPE